MIEVVSHPTDLATEDPKDPPFYLQVYGQTEPLLEITYAEVVPAVGEMATTITSTPIYEYWWTIGHPGQGPEHHHLWPGRPKDQSLWKKLDNPVARVYLYFPVHAGWRIKELVATVKYLSPVHDEETGSARRTEPTLSVCVPPAVARTGTTSCSAMMPKRSGCSSVFGSLGCRAASRSRPIPARISRRTRPSGLSC